MMSFLIDQSESFVDQSESSESFVVIRMGSRYCYRLALVIGHCPKMLLSKPSSQKVVGLLICIFTKFQEKLKLLIQ